MIVLTALVQIIHKSCRKQVGIEHSSFRLSEATGEDILAALRGFCLTPLKSPLAKGGLRGVCRNIGKKIRSNTLHHLMLQ